MGRGGNKKFKSDEIRTANVLICGSEATERLCLRSLSDMTLSPHPDQNQGKPPVIGGFSFGRQSRVGRNSDATFSLGDKVQSSVTLKI